MAEQEQAVRPAAQPRRRLRSLQHAAALVLGVAILVVLYWRIGWTGIVRAMRAADPALLGVALVFFVPQVLVTTWRWQLIGGTAVRLGFWEACRMVLAGSSLNVLLPSHLGDMCKGLMLGDKARHGVAGGLGLAMLDKFMDTLGLAVVLVVGGLFARKETTLVLLFWAASCVGVVALVVVLHAMRPIARMPERRMLAALVRGLNAACEVRHRPAAWAGSLLLSVLLWFLHIVQIYLFYLAVAGEAPLPAAEIFMRVPMAIFIGLLPLTLAGIGTRDGALMALIEPRAVAALVGLFCTLRYVVIAVLGVPAVLSLGPRLTRALETARGRKAAPGPGAGTADTSGSA